MKFEEIKRKFAINNSYFKNRRPQDPSTPLECLEYLVEHGKLPYLTNCMIGDDIYAYSWVYECFVEYQKRTAIKHEQFFTPIHVAEKMAEVFLKKTIYNNEKIHVTEPFCGYGQITHEMMNRLGKFFVDGLQFKSECFFKEYSAFDIDDDLVDFADMFASHYGKTRFDKLVDFYPEDFNDIKRGQITNTNVISNPPYNIELLTKFLTELRFWLKSYDEDESEKENIAVLLLPVGFVEKQTKAIKEAVSYYNIEIVEKIPPVFAHTKVHTEIVILTLKKA